jgi:hypothetical protein
MLCAIDLVANCQIENIGIVEMQVAMYRFAYIPM